MLADAAELYLRVSSFLGADRILPKSKIELLPILLDELLNQ